MPAIGSTTTTFRLDGGKELARLLHQVGKKESKKIIRKAIRMAAKPMIKTARQLVPRETGLLRASLGVNVKAYRRGGTITAVIGPRLDFKSKLASSQRRAKLTRKGVKVFSVAVGNTGNRIPANYAHLVEYGTQRHHVRAFADVKGRPRSNPSRGLPIGGGQYRQRVGLFARPKPFMRPAFDRNKANSRRIMGTEIWKGIKDSIRKSGGGL